MLLASIISFRSFVLWLLNLCGTNVYRPLSYDLVIVSNKLEPAELGAPDADLQYDQSGIRDTRLIVLFHLLT